MMDNKRKSLMHRIQKYAFAAHECALYLDCHPENKQALEKHKRATEMMREAVSQYESLYGPLTAESAGGRDWNWVKTAWPWHREED